MSKKNNHRNPTPEEMKRMIDDAFKGSSLLKNLEKTDEEKLLDKLQETCTEIRFIMQNLRIKFPLRAQRPEFQKAVQHAFFERFEKYDRYELINLFSAFMTERMMSHD